jgi:hypothetical protein
MPATFIAKGMKMGVGPVPVAPSTAAQLPLLGAGT